MALMQWTLGWYLKEFPNSSQKITLSFFIVSITSDIVMHSYVAV